ncbi:MAG: helix-turn-helix domain-containing protein [Nitrososphaerota archaeon]|nr:helix-turn-helix domain-containing protein [Nitrososphaerota archaeon]
MHQNGLEHTLRRRKHQTPPRKPIVNGEEEARNITIACSKPPEGFARWTLRLLTKNIIEQQIISVIGRETVRKTLKKQNLDLT